MSAEAEAAKIVVAVDLDEVLGAFVQALAAFHNAKYGSTLTPDAFHSYHFSDVWGGTNEEAAAKVSAFYESDHFAQLPPIAAAGDMLRSLQPHFRFVVVTGRQNVLEDRTRAWLDRHYPGVFEDVVFGNHYGAGKSRPKSELCREIGAQVLIDDNVAYAVEASHALPMVILFGTYAWNADGNTKALNGSGPSTCGGAAGAAAAGAAGDGSFKLPPNVVRAINWRHVAALLHRVRPKQSRSAAAAAAPAAAAAAGGDGSGSSDPATGGSTAPAGGGSTGGSSGGSSPTSKAPVVTLASLGVREVITINSAAAAAGRSRGGRGMHHHHLRDHDHHHHEPPTAIDYAQQVRRHFEVQPSIALTGTGHDCRLVAEAADLLVAAGDAVVTNMRTGADAAPPGRPRYPRLTITLGRTPEFLPSRFALRRDRERTRAAALALVAGEHPHAGEAEAEEEGGAGTGEEHEAEEEEEEEEAGAEEEGEEEAAGGFAEEGEEEGAGAIAAAGAAAPAGGSIEPLVSPRTMAAATAEAAAALSAPSTPPADAVAGHSGSAGGGSA